MAQKIETKRILVQRAVTAMKHCNSALKAFNLCACRLNKRKKLSRAFEGFLMKFIKSVEINSTNPNVLVSGEVTKIENHEAPVNN